MWCGRGTLSPCIGPGQCMGGRGGGQKTRLTAAAEHHRSEGRGNRENGAVAELKPVYTIIA